MSRQVSGGFTNGLAQADEAPLDYFFRYAANHFDALADLEEARVGDASAADMAFLEYFADSWREMAKAQAEKYAFVIAKNESGAEILDRLDLSYLKDVPQPTTEQRGRRRRKARLALP